jgi:hypothetical protein
MKPGTTPGTTRRQRLLLGALTVIGLAGVLSGVFYLYGQPGFLVMLSNQVWSCF